MEITEVGAFWVTALAFILTPGADWAYMITAGLSGRVAPANAGLLLGHLAYVVAVAAGLGALATRYPAALSVITVVGAAYLAWLGLGVLRHPAGAGTPTWTEAGSAGEWAARGFGVSALNPKVPVLLLALLPQFTHVDGSWPVGTQLAMLGLLHLATCAFVYTAVGSGARRVLAARPTSATLVSRVAGSLMIVLGAALLVEQTLSLTR
ncbi:LysE family translocator [Cellulomonas gilvus]|uniref:Lysine exporter protein (LYSE/YGGA) n=1 Tax=Cellulomonas gilvus (strain ATCC 13127 / NRRL B-14078) TaxID=593907 RepID=F8A681_CELGA|nr:LysE family translocator [Cellulomonas gilvus]AEI12237.1 Lysine exporter protein (LYSE/YGGA) [Cellulomonas gilvus ATCC 13127]